VSRAFTTLLSIMSSEGQGYILYGHSRPTCRGFLWNLAVTTQFTLIIASWLLVLMEVPNWGNWNIPFHSLWFVAHLIDALFHTRIDNLRNADKASYNFIMTEDHHQITFLDLAVVCIDAATLITQIGWTQLNSITTAASKIQISFLAYVLFVTLMRAIPSCSTANIEWETSGKVSSTASNKKRTN